LPDLDSPLLIAKRVVECDGKIIAFGCLRLTTEAIIVVDKEISVRTRAATASELILDGTILCQKLGLTDMHAFLTGTNKESFSKTLKQKFGFVSHTGEALVLEV
jgi:hypothetical protein